MKIYVLIKNDFCIHEYDNYFNVGFYIDEQKANAERDRLNKVFKNDSNYDNISYFVECYNVIV